MKAYKLAVDSAVIGPESEELLSADVEAVGLYILYIIAGRERIYYNLHLLGAHLGSSQSDQKQQDRQADSKASAEKKKKKKPYFETRRGSPCAGAILVENSGLVDVAGANKAAESRC